MAQPNYKGIQIEPESTRIQHLVLDTTPFFHIDNLLKYSENLYTVPEVIEEIQNRDLRRSILERIQLNVLPIKITQPDQPSLEFVVNFSKTSGDFAFLSKTDLKVLALALSLKKRFSYEEQVDDISIKQLEVQVGSEKSDLKNPDDHKETTEQDNLNVIEESLQGLSIEQKNGDEKTQSSDTPQSNTPNEEKDDDEGWITPKNIQRYKNRSFSQNTNVIPKELMVACMTADFTVQNILMQFQIHIISVNGLLIKQVQTWLLRCHACFKITKQMDKQFCPSCGSPSLIRTSYSVDDQGNAKIYLKKNFQYRLRGTKYPVPKPQGGKHHQEMIFREDQKEYLKARKTQNIQLKKFAKQEPFESPDYLPGLLMNSKQRSSILTEIPIGYGRKNPNAFRKARK